MFAAAVLASLAACVTPASDPPGVAPASALAVSQQPRCLAPPPGTIAVIPATPCDQVWVVTGDEGMSTLRSSSAGEDVLAAGMLPRPCFARAACEASGAVIEGRTLLVLRRHGPESEVPEELWLGVVFGERLLFASLWAGEVSVVDGTREGPTFALAPHLCGSHVALQIERRLPSVGGETAPESLRAGEGVLVEPAADEDEPRLEALTPELRATCRPMALELP